MEIESLDADGFRSVDYAVMAQAFASHKEMGRLADENIYQADVAACLREAGFRLASEIPIVASFDDFMKTCYLDFVVNEQVVYELKAATTRTRQHEAQLMNYLLMLDLRHGKMVNFRPASVQSRFVNATMCSSQRKAFGVAEQRWKAPVGIKEWIVEMLRDWGVGLELPLYHQAIVRRLGGEAQVTCQLPIARAGVELGNHRFHLVDEHSAFRITAYEQPSPSQSTRHCQAGPFPSATSDALDQHLPVRGSIRFFVIAGGKRNFLTTNLPTL